jgi:membrane protein DedA with SNARE-associated domain
VKAHALTLAVRVHQDFHGPYLGYLALGGAALVGWVGIPGAGEAALVTAAVAAAHHRLDLAEVVLVAWAGASAGGVVGWLIGLKGGRALIAVPGPFRGSRLWMLAQGQRFYERYGTLAVLFTPSWMAGIAEMEWRRYLLVNAVSALLWALSLGVGAYFAGPPVVDVFHDVGTAGLAILAAVVAAVALVRVVRGRRCRAAR